jgi:hypothetical protein
LFWHDDNVLRISQDGKSRKYKPPHTGNRKPKNGQVVAGTSQILVPFPKSTWCGKTALETPRRLGKTLLSYSNPASYKTFNTSR